MASKRVSKPGEIHRFPGRVHIVDDFPAEFHRQEFLNRAKILLIFLGLHRLRPAKARHRTDHLQSLLEE